MIDGVETAVSAAAVVVIAARPLAVVSSAAVGGGFTTARAIVNLHVPKDADCADMGERLAAFARRRALPAPQVGLLTSAWTEHAESALVTAGGVTALVVATVGLGNPVAAGHTERGMALPATINTIVVVEADAEPAALVNAALTVTEVKTAVLMRAGVVCADGRPATGTSTDAVVVAATGRGPRCRFGGPISELGWSVARAAHTALEAGVRRWLREHP
jgi:adenosylcobinamide hydrolase